MENYVELLESLRQEEETISSPNLPMKPPLQSVAGWPKLRRKTKRVLLLIFVATVSNFFTMHCPALRSTMMNGSSAKTGWSTATGIVPIIWEFTTKAGE